MKNNMVAFFGILLVASCSNSLPRRPINPKPSSTFFQNNIETTKKMFQLEEDAILKFIKKDTVHIYESTSNGFWYTYDTKIEENLATPKIGDIVELEYDIRDLNDSILYTKTALGIKNYIVDKEDFITGIQKGIKLMKTGETITFLFPSYNAFGISGDGNKIGINKTIKSTVTLINIK